MRLLLVTVMLAGAIACSNDPTLGPSPFADPNNSVNTKTRTNTLNGGSPTANPVVSPEIRQDVNIDIDIEIPFVGRDKSFSSPMVFEEAE